MPSQRILYIDLLKLFTIYLVLWGHAIMCFQPAYEHSVPFRVIYSFHMPLFMMLSGYFARSSMEQQAKTFFPKKFRQLLLPCVSWGVLCWLFITSGLIEGTFQLDIRLLFTGWLGLIDNFWFLKSCFVCYVLTWLCWRCGRYKVVAFLTVWLVCLMQGRWHLYLMFPCFLAGLWLRYDQGHWLFSGKVIFSVGLLFGVLLAYWLSPYYSSIESNLRLAMQQEVFSWFTYVWQLFYRIFLGLSGSLFFFSIFRRFLEPRTSTPLLNSLAQVGGVTLGIYVLQAIILETLMPCYISFSALSVSTIVWLMPLLAMVVLGVCLLIVRLIERNRLLSFLLLGKEYKRA